MKAAKEPCARCGGKLVRKRVTLERRIRGRLFLFEAAPVLTCTACQEVWVPAHVAKEMENRLRSRATAKMVRVPSFSLANVEAA